jgi:uncharacterized Zn-finger protein
VSQTAGGQDKDLMPSNTENRYTVKKSDLPLSCPMPGMQLWNSHPRVYLPVEDKGEVRCPYCGAMYRLVDSDSATS